MYHQPPQGHMTDPKRQKMWQAGSAPPGMLSFTQNGNVNPLAYGGIPQQQLAHAHANMSAETQQYGGGAAPRPPTRIFPLSKRCRHSGGCHKKIQSKGLCIQHGGGRRCQNKGGCGKGAAGRTNFCFAHGGGARCKFKLTDGLGCNKHVVVNGLCLKHSRVANCESTEVASPEDIAAALIRAQQMIDSGVVPAPSPIKAAVTIPSQDGGPSALELSAKQIAVEVLSDVESVLSSPSSSSEGDNQEKDKGKATSRSLEAEKAKVTVVAAAVALKKESSPVVEKITALSNASVDNGVAVLNE